jgi:hypothetical protein
MTRLRRIAPLSGALAAVLWSVAVVVLEVGGNPAGPDSAEEIAAHFRDDRSAILASGTLHVLGGFFFLWFVSVLGSALRPLDDRLSWLRTAALVGGTAAGAMMLALTGPQTTGATTDEELLSPDAALAFWRLAHTFFIGAEFAFAVFVAAVSLVALAGFLLPRWLGWFGLFVTLVLLVVPVGWIALLLLVPIWLAVVSVLLFTRTRDTASIA